jgi:hypothetical protein
MLLMVLPVRVDHTVIEPAQSPLASIVPVRLSASDLLESGGRTARTGVQVLVE